MTTLSPHQKTPLQRKLYKTFRYKWQLMLMILLPLVWYIIFCYTPMYGVQIAFRDYSARKGYLGSPFVGLKHFERFFSSYYCRDVIGNTLSISLFSLAIGFPAPILLAIIINELPSRVMKKTLQNLTYIPHFLSTVVLCSMLYLFLSREYGVVNKLIEMFGGKATAFLENDKYFHFVYVLSGVWQESGWSSIIYIAALSGIDPALYEAATIDGANRLQRVRHISLPGIVPTIVMLLVLRMGSLMSVGFEKALLLQNDLNLGASEIISTLVYKRGILKAELSFSTAVGLMNSVINLILIVGANTFCNHFFEEGLW